MLRRIAVLLVCFSFLLAGCVTGASAKKFTKPSEHPPKFAEGTTMATLQQAKQIRVGVKFDQPNLGYKPAGAKTPAGFDVEIAKIIATHLGLKPAQISWVQTESLNREKYLPDGTVDIVVASYSMTPERQSVVGQAGPYLITGQQIMVRKDDTTIDTPEDLKDKPVCTVAGSSSSDLVIKKYHADSTAYNSYADCLDALLDGEVEAVSTDGAILMGFLINHVDDVKLVGEPFTTERYGIGYRLGDNQFCEFLTKTLLKSYKDGTWSSAFETTLGSTGIEAPDAPQPDKCLS